MSERSNYFLIEDIQESASRILTYTSDMTFDQFTSDQKTIDAVIRNFEIIGEAANRIANDFKEKFSDIPWRRLSDSATG